MSVSSTDILLKLSTKAGAAGNTTAGTPAGSLGKYISTTAITPASLHNLFDIIEGGENAASESEYRCIFIHNNNATDDFLNVFVYILSEVSDGASVAIGVDPTAASDIDSASAQALEVADEDTAPAGVSFTSPTDLANGIDVGDIPAGSCRAIWIKRTAANTAAMTNDGATLRIQGETL